jgi:Putative polyhydroxyalkanoic acid system protein (PHA_gran_rgn)
MMAKKTIEKAFPGKSADVLYVEVERIIQGLGKKYGITCAYDPVKRRIVVPETMGVSGLCAVHDGRVTVDLEHGLMGTAVVGTVKGYIEDKLGKLFA